jgi:hypothetical protein
VSGRSVRHWSAVRTKLSTFATITQDGDDEGVARLHDLPVPEQAEVIRDAGQSEAAGGLHAAAVAARGVGQGFRLQAEASRRGGFSRQDRRQEGGLGG